MNRIKYLICFILLLSLFILFPKYTYAYLNDESEAVPIIFIHGYNSHPSAWTDTEFYELFKNSSYKDIIYTVDYSANSRNDITSSFIQNELKETIDDILSSKKKNDRFEQVDVVTHSMGGLALRWFLYQNPEYMSKIRNVQFVGTPHHGAEIAFVNRLVSVYNKPELYYDLNGQDIDDYLADYKGYYSDYLDKELFSFISKPKTYEEWLNENNPQVLRKVKQREHEKIIVPGDSTNSLGGNRLPSTEEYRYSGAFEEYSKIMLGKYKYLMGTSGTIKNSLIKTRNEHRKIISPYYLEGLDFDLSFLAPLSTELIAEADTSKGESSVHNIVQDRLMREHFHIYAGKAEDGRIIQSNIIANPFLYTLNKEEYTKRMVAFSAGKQIPIYTTLRGQHSGNYFDVSSYSNFDEAKFKGLALATSLMSNIDLWEPEGHDGVVPLSSAKAPPVLFDENIFYSQRSVSHSGLTHLTGVLSEIYNNPFTRTNDSRITYNIDRNLSTNLSNPLILKNTDFFKEEKEVTLELSSNSPTNVRVVTRDEYGKYIGNYKEVSLLKGEYTGAKGYLTLEYDENVHDYLVFNFTTDYLVNHSQNFSIKLHDDEDHLNEEGQINLTDDKSVNNSYAYTILPLETEVNMSSVNHRFKVIHNFDDNEDNIAEFNERDFKVFESQIADDEKKTIYPYTVTLEEINQKQEEQNIVLALDYSESMRDDHALVHSKNASENYISNLESYDIDTNISVVGFSDSPHTFMDFTKNYRLASLSVHNDISGGTAIYDTVIYSVDKLKNREGQRNIILMTDGSDVSSRSSIDEAISYANNYDVSIYLVALGGDINSHTLETLASHTGGQVFYTYDASQLNQIYDNITTHNEYIFNLNYHKRTSFQNPFHLVFGNKDDSDELITYIELTKDRSDEALFLYDFEQDGLYRYAVDEIKEYISDKKTQLKDHIQDEYITPIKTNIKDGWSFIKGIGRALLW